MKNRTVVPSAAEARCCPNFAVIIAQRDWTEGNAPALAERHPETKRNELFLMNVTASEFEHLRHVKMPDFKAVRLGIQALTADGKPVTNFRPMFGALKRGARLRRKAAKTKGKT